MKGQASKLLPRRLAGTGGHAGTATNTEGGSNERQERNSSIHVNGYTGLCLCCILPVLFVLFFLLN